MSDSTEKKTLTVKLVKSVAGTRQSHRDTVRGLGLRKVSLRNGSIQHNVRGEHGAAKVLMAPAAPGTGIIAGGPMRAVFEVMGVTDIVAKSLGSSNPYNMVRATLDALKRSTTAAEVAAKRGKTVEDILG